MEIGDRLKLARKQLGLTQNELASLLNIKGASVCDIERGKIKTITDRNLKTLKDELKINPLWLKTGEGSMMLEDKTNRSNNSINGVDLANCETKDINALFKIDNYWNISKGVLLEAFVTDNYLVIKRPKTTCALCGQDFSISELKQYKAAKMCSDCLREIKQEQCQEE